MKKYIQISDTCNERVALTWHLIRNFLYRQILFLNIEAVKESFKDSRDIFSSKFKETDIAINYHAWFLTHTDRVNDFPIQPTKFNYRESTKEGRRTGR